MRTSRAVALTGAALVIGFFAARWCAAQPTNPPPAKEPLYDFGALRQLESFVAYLQNTTQTSMLQRFNDYLNSSLASRHYADIGETLAILHRIRDGRTNQALELLEGRLNSEIIGFAASYRELPETSRQHPELKVLGQARDYRARYPFKQSSSNATERLTDAFKILDKK